MVVDGSRHLKTGKSLSWCMYRHFFKPLLRFFAFIVIITAILALPWADADAAVSPPGIQWQRSLGGSSYEVARSIQQTSDGGYVVAGISQSNDGDISGNHGSYDCWVAKLDAGGNIVWQKSLGGSNSDAAYAIQQTSDGGYIVAGISQSNDGDVSGNHGSNDYWVVKLDAGGNIVWQKSLGGSNGDIAYSIQQTSDGGYIVAGMSFSNNGDITGHHGIRDCWVVKLDTGGTIEWEKSLGGSGYDDAHSIQQTSDGGYIVAGISDSNDGDVTGNHGNWDYWIVKLNAGGTIVWQKSLGGSGNDLAYAIDQTGDGGYVIAGQSESTDGDVSGNHGDMDYWVVRLDASGNIQWQKSLGGSDNDQAHSIRQTSDGGYIVAGYSQSTDGDVSGNHGDTDYWVVKLDASGNTQWQKSLGGSDSEMTQSIQQTGDGGYIVAGSSNSIDGDVIGNHGDHDYWIVKLYSDTHTVTFNSQGGSAVSQLSYVQSGTAITAPTAPTRSGYSFIGWYKEAACTNAWNFATDTVTANITLYAKWTAVPTYTVTFDSQGGSAVASVMAAQGAAITAPASPTRAGYSFAGWYKEAACVNAWDFAADTVASDVTLYAKWTEGGIPGSVVSLDIKGFPLTVAPGGSFDVTVDYGAFAVPAPDPPPVLTAQPDSDDMVRVDVLSANSARVTALPRDFPIARSARGNSAIHGDAGITFTASQTLPDGTVLQKSAVKSILVADDLATPVAVSEDVVVVFEEANTQLVSSDETILPGSVQQVAIAALGSDWHLIEGLDNALIEIENFDEYVLPVCFEPSERDAARIDIDLSGLVPSGKKGLLPLTFRVKVRAVELFDLYGEDTGSAMLASPEDHLDEIFAKIVLQKEIMEGSRKGWYTRLVDGVLKPREAVEKGILEVTGGESLTLSLSFYVLDDDILEAFEQDGYLIVPDGHYNEKIRDPIWVNRWKDGLEPGGNSESGGQGSGSGSGSGGGCAGTGGVALLAALLLAFVISRKGVRR
ncbi:MAG: InlB B-repeat-containing protein [Synergistaceae bacterium]|nr:InlB B-repeat-containing protein [Synergistaceae bacterium]